MIPSPTPVALSALSTSGISLRPVTAADASLLRALYGDARAEELARVPWPREMRERFLDDQFRFQLAHFDRHNPRADRFIVTRSAPPLAAADVGRLYVDRGSDTWRLIEITIAAAHRNQGIGSALIAWVQEGAAGAGAGCVTLQVAHDNPAAQALYRRCGFTEVESGPTHRLLRWQVS